MAAAPLVPRDAAGEASPERPRQRRVPPSPGGDHLRAAVESWASAPTLAAPTASARPLVDQLVPAGPLRDALRGNWLGHALHPLVTDLPIGSWTSAMVLDLVGGRSARPAARRLVALGLLTTPLAALTGAAEWADADEGSQRLGLVHAAGNVAAALLYLRSYRLRRRDRHLRGVAYGLAGGAVATFSGYLGGHLAFRRGLGTEVAAAAADGEPSARPASPAGLDHPADGMANVAPLTTSPSGLG